MARGREYVTITIYDKNGKKVDRDIDEARIAGRKMKSLLDKGYSKREAKRMLSGGAV